MRNWIIAVLMVCVMSMTAYAGVTTGQTFNSPNGDADDFVDFLNDQDYVDHTHQHNDMHGQAWEGGIGADLTVFVQDESSDKKIVPDEVVIEVKYDITNDQGGTYLVAKYNLWDKLIKGLLNKDEE